jgi:hypothetical protein
MKNSLNLFEDFVAYANGTRSWERFIAARDARAKAYSVATLTETRVTFSDGLSFDIPEKSSLDMRSWGPLQWCRWQAIYGGITPRPSRLGGLEGSHERADGAGRTPNEYCAALEDLTGRNW